MRIAIVEPYPAASGLENVSYGAIYRERELCSVLASRGHEVAGYKTTRSSHRTAIVEESFTWAFVPIDPMASSLPDGQVVCSALVRDLQGFAPDVVIIRGAGTSLGAALLADLGSLAVTIIGGRYRTSSLLLSDIILTETDFQERFLRPRVGRERLIRWPKLLDAAFSAQASSLMELEYDVVVVSKFEAHKNHWALVPLLDEDISIAFVGDGSLRARFEAESVGRRARVHFTGDIPNSQVASVVGRSRILVHPSKSEGFPRAVAEAMTAGRPCVCVVGVVGEPVTDGLNGILVSSSEIPSAVISLLADPAKLQQLSRNAKLTADRAFSPQALEQAIDALLAAMTRCLAGGAGGYARYRRSTMIRRSLWDASSRVSAIVRSRLR